MSRITIQDLECYVLVGLFRGPLARDELERLMEECKSSVRAKVEHLFFYVKQMFSYGKVRYRSLGKNENRLALLLGFANLLRAESCMV